MKKQYTIFISSIVTTIALFIFPTFAQGATLYFSTPESVSVGDVFSIDVHINSLDKGFNASEGTILFPKDILEIISIDTAPSSTIFNFWLTLPSFSNEKGIVSYSGGTTNGILGPSTQILTIRAKAKGIGSALITATDASINASDGSGTNILEKIDAKYITINKPIVTVPIKPKTVTPTITKTKQTQIVPTPKQEPALTESRCSVLFANCDLHFPSIDRVTVSPQSQTGFSIFVSGTATEGTHTHLSLKRDGVLYKEIEAIVKDGKWEGLFKEIFAYGTYSIDAYAEIDPNQKSESITWNNIYLSPPYTFHGFGITLRWYAIVNIILYTLVIIYGAIILRRRIFCKDKICPSSRFLSLAWILWVALVGMSIATYFLWKKEYATHISFWKKTNIQCMNINQSYDAKLASIHLEIFIDKKPQIIPADIGIAPNCIAQIHTHGQSGRFHIDQKAKTLTLFDLFTVAGSSLEQNAYSISVIVNGKDYTKQLKEYHPQNGDTISISYTSIK